MKLARFIVLIILILPNCLHAQDEKATVAVDSSSLIISRLESGTSKGRVRVVQDPRLTSILRKHVEFNKSSGVAGWRILIYKGREMTKANQLKADFEEAFGQLNLRTDVKYFEPDFSVLVGSFRTKEDAYRYKQMLSTKFPQAYLVQAQITLD